MAEFQHFAVQQVDDVAVVQVLEPKLSDSLTVSEFQDELLAMIDTDLPKKLVVSFKGVQQCSTAIINGLLRAKDHLTTAEGKLRLCGMSAIMRKAYSTLNLDGRV
jgi:anti-anti-sigma regulatory factor